MPDAAAPVPAAAAATRRDASARDVIAIVPLSPLRWAKGRLAGAVDDRRRVELVGWMLERVLQALAAGRAIQQVHVVAGDRAAAACARELGATVHVQDGHGLPAALDSADGWFAGAACSLVVASDLPLITVADVDALCTAGAAGPRVVVAPTQDGGTAALLRRPHAVIPSAYGPGSGARHRALARAAGVACTWLPRPALALDVDTPAALVQAGLGGWLEARER